MTVSVWFWNDINDELSEYDFSYSLTTTIKIWRWTLTFISLNFLIQSLQNFDCFSYINSYKNENNLLKVGKFGQGEDYHKVIYKKLKNSFNGKSK